MRAPAKIDGGGGKGLVHGHQEISGAQNAAFVAERGVDRFAQSDADVLDGVVLVHVEVALGASGEDRGRHGADQVEHVIEKGNARGDFRLPRPSRFRRSSICVSLVLRRMVEVLGI